MTIDISDVTAGILTLTVSGVIARSDLLRVQACASELLAAEEHMCVLVLADRFAGWDRGADRDDRERPDVPDNAIEKMAIVTQEKWRQLGSAFIGRRIRSCPIAYFLPTDVSRARQWLTEA